MPHDLGKVLVTGATGPVGAACVVKLCQAGYRVQACTRDSARATAFTAKYPDLPITWSIVTDQSVRGKVYNDAITGCIAAIHACGPFHWNFKTAVELIEMQTNGILNLLDAAAGEPSIRRVVHFSSVSTIHPMDPTPLEDGAPLEPHNEECWNPVDRATATDEAHNTNQYYAYGAGKTLSEKAAMAYVKENETHFDLTVLCPGTAYGEPFHVMQSLEDIDTATARLLGYMSQPAVPPTPFPCFTNPANSGEAAVKVLQIAACGGQRYQLISDTYSYAKIARLLKAALPEHAHRLPKDDADVPGMRCRYYIDCAKADRDLQIKWKTLEESIIPEGRNLFDLPPKRIPKFSELPLDKSHPKHSAWIWGPNDQLGTLNHLTRAVVKSASSTISTGERVTVDWSLDLPKYPYSNREGFSRRVINKAPTVENDDVITFNTQCSSQWDSLRHYGYQDSADGPFYNGTTLTTILEPGSRQNELFSTMGIAGRGVLLDYYRYACEQGRSYQYFDGKGITLQELLRCADYFGVRFRRGDILLVRFGHTAAYNTLTDDDRKRVAKANVFGGVQPSKDMLEWIWNTGFSAIAGDGVAFEVVPFSDDNEQVLHHYVLAGFGCPIGELFDLEALSEVCMREKRYSFFFTSSPLKYTGAIASPPCAMCIF